MTTKIREALERLKLIPDSMVMRAVAEAETEWSALEAERDALRTEAAQKINNLERGLSTATRERDELKARVVAAEARLSEAHEAGRCKDTANMLLEADRDSAWDAAIEAAAIAAETARHSVAVDEHFATYRQACDDSARRIRALKRGGK